MKRPAALLLLACAGPAAAGTYTWGATLDGGYARTDTRQGDFSSAGPAWDFGAQLSLGAIPLRPDALQLAAAGSYRLTGSSSDTSTIDSKARADSWGYSVSAGALQFLPLSFSGFASRSQTDFSTTTESPLAGTSLATTTQLTGLSTTTAEGIGALFKMDRVPTVSARLQRTEYDNTGVGGLKSTGKNTVLSLGGSHTLENHDYSVGYDRSWNEGSFSDNNYRSHQASFRGHSSFANDLDLTLNQSYLLRVPSAGSVVESNPRFDDNLTNAEMRWRASPALSTGAGYAYRRMVVDFPTLADLETQSHAFHAGASWNRTKELSFNADASAAFGLERGGSSPSRRNSGQSLSLGARYGTIGGETTWSVGGSGSIGLSQSGQNDYFAYGFGASAGLSTFVGGWSTSLSYDGSYSSNLAGQIGFTLRNALTGSGDTRSAGGVRYRGQLQISDGRQQQKILDRTVDSSAQTATATASVGWSVHYVDLSVGLSNAASPALGGPSGGLGVPKSLNTQSRFATLSASTVLLPNLTLAGFARYVSISLPVGADAWEGALNGRLSYAIGLVTLSLEDRYTVGAQGGPTLRTNVVLVRLSRSFGGVL